VTRERDDRLTQIDPESLSREELVALVGELQTALAGQRGAASRPAKPAASARQVPGADFTLVFDGGSINNPGRGYGSYEVVDHDGQSLLDEQLQFGNNITNNQAEFMALIAGLKALLTLTGDRAATASIAIRGDSQLVIRGLTGEWRVKHPGLQPLHRQALDLLGQFGSVDIAWHPRRESVRVLGH
jgi:ribonuclease HI